MRTTHRKRRIRKKWRIGEFTEYGFEVRGQAPDPEFCNRAIKWVEANGMTICGGFKANGEFSATIAGYDYARKKDRSLDGEDLARFSEFLQESGATDLHFSELFDVNHLSPAVEELIASLDAVTKACKNFTAEVRT